MRMGLNGIFTRSLSLLVLGVMVVVCTTQAAPTRDPAAAYIDDEGTLHISPLSSIPPSNLWSPEFKSAYLDLQHLIDRAPAIDAPGADAEFEKLNAALAEDLASKELARNPVDIKDGNLAGVHVNIITPKGGPSLANQHRVLINLHTGTGLGMGRVESIPIAAIGKIQVITTVDGNDQPLTAIRGDVEVLYKALLRQYKAQSIGIFGCGGGGVRVAQTLARFQKSRLPMLGAAGIFCAPLPIGPSQRDGDSGALWPADLLLARRTSRAKTPDRPGGGDPSDSETFPGSDDALLAKFPPTLWLTGTRSFELSSVVVAHGRLLGLGVDSYLYIVEGGWHGSELTGTSTPEGRATQTYIAHWFDQHLAR